LNFSISGNLFKGIGIASIGALILSPDTLFMRWSEMDVWSMLTWRGLEMGIILILFSSCFKIYRSKYKNIYSPVGLSIIISQIISSLLFTYGIAETSVSLILFCLATSPIFASLFSIFILGEKTNRATWITAFFALVGVGIAVLNGDDVINAPQGSVLIGTICGIGASATLGLSLVLLRFKPNVPAMTVTGVSALGNGFIGLLFVEPNLLFQGDILSISFSGLVILPISFACLTFATRYTPASNIGLLMLLETALGPFWVWIGTTETPNLFMILGGVIVISSLAWYILIDQIKFSITK
jgi:drug/metabolite transporter (DMT)-like permease|tara:strand:+ start:10739 stop:11632 length:894 start_codon:yes stop_codon:yes gene_type:complete